LARGNRSGKMDFPKATAEEGTVTFRVFEKVKRSDTLAGTSDEAIAERLARCFEMERIAAEVAGSYQWNKEVFRIFHHAPQDNARTGGAGRSFVEYRGSTKFGDCYQDEWLIVLILVQISRRFPELIIQVQDDDGEFILIEAADHLPSWVTPDNSVNACFIRGGNFHLLLPEQWPGGEKPNADTSLARGLALLHSAVPATKHLVSRGFQAQIETRLAEFQVHNAEYGYDSLCSQLSTHSRCDLFQGGDGPSSLNHTQRCLIPAKLAAMLETAKSTEHRPQLDPNYNWVSQAASIFYLRDPDQVRSANKFRHFPLEDLVVFPVQFSRMAFARLLRQKVRAAKFMSGAGTCVCFCGVCCHIVELTLEYLYVDM